MSYAIGSLVKVRGREWVVQAESSNKLLILKPLGGTDAEITGILTSLETVESATFGLPQVEPNLIGDHRSCRMLRDAVRLASRNTAGPFRSFGRIAVEPRPYQLVPLLVALKLDPIRILIADDVGIGKTIEAALIARELLDRGEIEKTIVLCPPQLAGQWQQELSEKFHIQAQVLLPSTARKLERKRHRLDESVFDIYDHLIVSTDYIKADRRRDEFIRACPDFVIVDEAHTFAFAGHARSGHHQRHELLKRLAADPARHLVLVTATPHSGKEEAFRSLLTFLSKDFVDLPSDLGGAQNQQKRRNLAQYLVQRRRGDIKNYLGAETPFPERQGKEETYSLSAEYKKFFDRALEYAREIIRNEQSNQFHQRVRWWSVLALLRSLASSPAAAAETLRNRAATAEAESLEDADEIGKRTVLDLDQFEEIEGADVAPGSDPGEEIDTDKKLRRRLQEMARIAESLKGDKDEKLKKSISFIKELVDDGFRPIVFCRFIPTVQYLIDELRVRLPKGITVAGVTGLLPPAEREERILQLAESEKRVLVCTDCLSEGINLQEHFDAVMHYDLSWNPTRHEQREGRVDRFGQKKSVIRAMTYYGIDNQIDGIVIDVLLRKHQSIRNDLGISVPVPVESDKIAEALFEGLLLRERAGTISEQLILFEDFLREKKESFHSEWEESAEREKRSRTMFAQETIKPEEVNRELKAAQESQGTKENLIQFLKDALIAHKAVLSGNDPLEVDFSSSPRALRDAFKAALIGKHSFHDAYEAFQARFDLPVSDDEIYLSRSHPIVESLANYIVDTALNATDQAVAKRIGAIRTKIVITRKTLLLVRFRFHIKTIEQEFQKELLAEECRIFGFEGSPKNATWLPLEKIESLLIASPDANIAPEVATNFINEIVESNGDLTPYLEKRAEKLGQEILEAHRRVRTAARMTSVRYQVEPKLPPDIIGIYIFLPVGGEF